MIFGHIVNIMIPLILPWTFIMLDSGVRNYKTKINAVCCLILYFLGLFFPIYYLFELLMDRENKLIKERNEIIRQNNKNNVSMTIRKDMWRDYL